ncbi:6,7-dimethyl-8-ribityllumazine synthase [Nocardia asteroides]|uniref:6,7-dimethyl-8-ribityllumazine synthase n=1 Tax=Nocardia asteroides TaxID=1824 RepID=UPI001E2E227A|nr:6,7-dimethyl-8-ribityllumazine synthase [Nocardia asteroides]UGT59028.1 6,7-dimethyl-8-ribityllumazine synthase [Nocardia asteroides]
MRIAIDTSGLPAVTGARVAVVQSKWYREQVDRMADACRATLRAAGAAEPTTHLVPGALEMPLAVTLLLRSDPALDAVICLGAVLKGDTYHFEMVVDACGRGLAEVSREHLTPVINEVLPITDLADLDKRSQPDEFNKGREAAAAAVEFIAWRRALPATP